MKVVDLIKQAIPWSLQPWYKSFLSIAAVALTCGFLVHPLSRGVVVAMGAAGFSALFHEVTSWVGALRDDHRQTVRFRALTGPRRSSG
jgi:hypothetical protein